MQVSTTYPNKRPPEAATKATINTYKVILPENMGPKSDHNQNMVFEDQTSKYGNKSRETARKQLELFFALFRVVSSP